MIILHFIATKDDYKDVLHRRASSPLGDMFRHFLFLASRTVPKHSGKEMKKDDDKCLNCLKNIMYNMLLFLFQADLLSQCLFEGLCYKTCFIHTRLP